MIAVVYDTKLAHEWDQVLDPPKTGNIKDPAKIQAKIDAWKQNAEAEALLNPYASIITHWAAAGFNGTEGTSSGEGELSLAGYIFSCWEAIRMGTMLVGIEMTSMRKRLALSKPRCDFKQRLWLWRCSHLTQPIGIIDLWDLFISGWSGSADRAAAKYFGHTKQDLLAMPLHDRLAFIIKMAENMLC